MNEMSMGSRIGIIEIFHKKPRLLHHGVDEGCTFLDTEIVLEHFAMLQEPFSVLHKPQRSSKAHAGMELSHAIMNHKSKLPLRTFRRWGAWGDNCILHFDCLVALELRSHFPVRPFFVLKCLDTSHRLAMTCQFVREAEQMCSYRKFSSIHERYRVPSEKV